jgi:hypothetical protein
VALGTIAGCPAPHQLGLVDQLVADPTHINSVTVTRDSEAVDFFHPATVHVDGQTGDVDVKGGDGGSGGGGGVTINVHTTTTGGGTPQPQPATPKVAALVSVSIDSVPPNGQPNYYPGDTVRFKIVTQGNGWVEYLMADSTVVGRVEAKDGVAILNHDFSLTTGAVFPNGEVVYTLCYFWPEDQNDPDHRHGIKVYIAPRPPTLP